MDTSKSHNNNNNNNNKQLIKTTKSKQVTISNLFSKYRLSNKLENHDETKDEPKVSKRPVIEMDHWTLIPAMFGWSYFERIENELTSKVHEYTISLEDGRESIAKRQSCKIGRLDLLPLIAEATKLISIQFN